MANLRKILIDLDEAGQFLDATFFFTGSTEPFGIQEFAPGSPTRQQLEHLIANIQGALMDQEPLDAAQTAPHNPGAYDFEVVYGHGSIHLPDTDTGLWGCTVCWQTGSLFPGDTPQDKPCTPRQKPSDWNMAYG